VPISSNSVFLVPGSSGRGVSSADAFLLRVPRGAAFRCWAARREGAALPLPSLLLLLGGGSVPSSPDVSGISL